MLNKFLKLIGLLIIAGIIYLAYFTFAIYESNEGQGIEKTFSIEAGQGVNEISQNLYKEGLIDSKWNFELYLWMRGVEDKLKAGDYLLNDEMNIIEITRVLVAGQVIRELEITIIEGWNNKKIAKYLDEKDISSESDFLSLVEDAENFKNDYDFLQNIPEGVDLEGYLFPDTYRIYSDAGTKDIIKKMLNNFGKKVILQMMGDIESQDYNLHEIITLASIIEKEVATNESRALVSDIFRKRLEIGMPLQSDSTINYVLGTSTTRPTLDQLREADSPYNTYKHKGLPPGPICNPSLSSIKAAIYPENNDHWYFLTTEDGTVIYSKTNDEHAANKAKYLK